MFKDMTLRMKLILGFLVMIGLSMLLGWRSIVNMEYLNGEISSLRVEQFKPTKLISKANVDLLDWNRALLAYVQAKDPQIIKSELNKVKKIRENLSELFSELESAKVSNRALEHLNELKSRFDQTHVYEEQVISLARKKQNSEAIDVIQSDIDPLIRNMDLTMEKLTQLQTRQFKEAIATSDKNYAEARNVMLGVIGLTIILGIALTFLISRSIINPFRNVFKGLKTFSTRELEELSDSFNKIVDDLKSGAEQVNAASSQISDASQILSSSSNEQASSIEENSSSLEEISGMVEKNVNSSEDSDKLSSEVGDRMQKLVSAMGELKESNGKIQGLVQVIGEIGEKTKVIDEIVFQTKMLSFNASVEAERAGEHGRGFAIVAQEVGNLAEMSGKAAMEISNIVKDSIQQAEGITNENAQRVETGNELAQYTLDQSAKLSETARQISVASKEQSKGINQVNDTLANLSKSTQELSTTAEETASSSEELNGQAECLNQVVEQMIGVLRGNEGEVSKPKSVPAASPSSITSPSSPKNEKVLSFASKSHSSTNVTHNNEVIESANLEQDDEKIEDVEKHWKAL